MRFRPTLIALAVTAVATAAQAQSSLLNDDPLTLPSRTASTPTPAQPLVKPGIPSRPEQPMATTVPTARPAAPAAPAVQDAGRTVRLEQEQAHPSGVAMMLTGITYRADSVIVSASILNLSDRPVSLNRGGSLALVDDRGRAHPFVPPADNPEVQVAPRSRVTANFVFAGPLTGGTRSVQLSANGPTGSRNDRLTSAPSFQFRVPVS
jgi:hypothetical protein